MNSSRLSKRSVVRHLGMLFLALVAVAAGSTVACFLPPDAGGGGEGDRCNPSLSHNDCGGGLTCTQPTDCPENYCCPTSGNSSNPNCQAGCNGGAFSIAVANFYLTCSTTTPSPLCSCFSPEYFVMGDMAFLQPDAGPLCNCFTQADPVACLAAAEDGGTPEGGSAEGSTEGGGSEGAAPEASTMESSTPESSTPEASTEASTDAGGQ